MSDRIVKSTTSSIETVGHAKLFAHQSWWKVAKLFSLKASLLMFFVGGSKCLLNTLQPRFSITKEQKPEFRMKVLCNYYVMVVVVKAIENQTFF